MRGTAASCADSDQLSTGLGGEMHNLLRRIPNRDVQVMRHAGVGEEIEKLVVAVTATWTRQRIAEMKSAAAEARRRRICSKSGQQRGEVRCRPAPVWSPPVGVIG